jgi:hypothetical protein
MLYGDDSVMGKLAKNIHGGPYEYFPEYYAIDAVFCKSEDYIQPNPPDKTWGSRPGFWLKKIAIAVEHENNVYSAYQEICHLLTTSADTKVVITYPPTRDCDKKCANDFQTIVKDLDADTVPVLLIFGYRDGTVINWEGFVLRAGQDKPEKL